MAHVGFLWGHTCRGLGRNGLCRDLLELYRGFGFIGWYLRCQLHASGLSVVNIQNQI